MLQLIAQAAQASPQDDGVSYGLVFAILAVELTLSGLTWRGFNAESRLERDRDSDIRDAEAGYESGRVLLAVTNLIEAVLANRRHEGESVRDALDRSDASGQLQEVIDAAALRAKPRDIEERLVRIWTVVAIATLSVQLSGPIMLLNATAGRDLLSDTVQTVAGVVMIASIAILAVTLCACRQLDRALSRSIRSGKDAARAS